MMAADNTECSLWARHDSCLLHGFAHLNLTQPHEAVSNATTFLQMEKLKNREVSKHNDIENA